jgi:4-amino-4-deoxy-L-arabinose transferase-like glycosyltransferase
MIEPPSGPALTQEVEAPSGGRDGLSVRVDVLLWLALIAAAAALRLARLGTLPLTFEESARAFDALRASQNAVPEGWNGDLTAAVTSYLFRIFGEGDYVARLGPAVAGAAMVAILWLGGRALGRTGALVAAALLAFSPLALLVSRSALPFSTGAALAVGMTIALLSYLREPRASTAFLVAVTVGLALTSDAVGVTAVIAVVAFLLLERAMSPEGEVARAWAVFRRSPAHWLSVGLVLVGAFELAITHFGTFVGSVEPAGLGEWRHMFALPRDDRSPAYQLAVLLAYDWPVLLCGGAAVGVLVRRLRRRGVRALPLAQRFLLLWTALAALAVALANQREAGQIVILLLPLALLAGLLADELLPRLDWGILRRWWPVPAIALALLAYAALLGSEWSRPGFDITQAERFYLVLAVGAAGAILVAPFSVLGRRAVAISMVVVVVLAFAFLVHTDLSLTTDEGVEFAVDVRGTGRMEQFHETVAEVVATRAGPVIVDPSLREPLAWPLRDLAVTFAVQTEDAAAVVVPAGREVEGFTPLGEPWRVGEGWYPPDLDLLRLWRWLVYREAYGNLDSVDAQILVPEP